MSDDTTIRGFNKVLADRYFVVASQYTGSWDTYLKQKRIIAGAEVDITAFYDSNNGNLKDLCIRGIGSKTKKILETILSEGQEAKGIVAREKEAGLNQTPKDRHKYDVREELPRVQKE